jgi:hypothetical protein
LRTCPGAAGLRTDPASAFRRPLALLCANFLKAAFTLAVFRLSRIAKRLRSKRRTFPGGVVPIARGHPRTRFDERRLPSSSTTRAGDAGETDLSRSRMIHHVERCRFGDFAARAGSCTDASFSAVFRYPPLRPFCRAAQPVDRFLPSGGNDLWRRVAARGSPLDRRRSWGSALRRFYPAFGWSRVAIDAAK